MSQDDLSTQGQIAQTPEMVTGSRAKKPRKKLLRWLGGGCLSLLLCIGIGFGAAFFTGVLSGTHGARDDMPAWSPDGSRIAFMSNRDGNSDIYTMNPDGSQVRQLTRDPFASLYFAKSPTDAMPAWTPDGRQIVFYSGRDNIMWSYIVLNIYKMNVDGSHVVSLTQGNEISAYPAVSPDGKKIAFAQKKMFTPSGPAENSTWAIYVMDIDSSHLVQLTSGPANDQSPAWSPDGSQILFVSDRSGFSSIYTMHADGSNVVRLTKEATNYGEPAWSPDGDHIAFTSDRRGTSAIYVMNADGTNQVQLTSIEVNAGHPSWSPNSSQIAFACDLHDEADIFIMNADGTNLRRLTGE